MGELGNKVVTQATERRRALRFIFGAKKGIPKVTQVRKPDP